MNTEYVYSDLSMITLMYVIGVVSANEGLTDAADLRADCMTGSAEGQVGGWESG